MSSGALGEKVDILLVDDNPEGMIALEASLEPLGQNVIKASSGREALRKVLQHDFAVILLDIQMPEMDGLETAQAIRERDRSRITPIIFMTASVFDAARAFEGYAKGAVDYLFKPVSAMVIRSKVSVFVKLAIQAQQVNALNSLLNRQSAELLAANRELEAFTHTVSHDLRTPLRHIHEYSEMLAAAVGDQLSAKASRYLKVIHETGVEMDAMIDDLLNFSRMNQAELTESKVSLDALIQEVLEGLETSSRGRNIVWNIAPLPEVLADRSMLKHVLINLMGNAVKYSRTRDPATLEVGCAGEEDQRVVVFVRDNGVGFDMRYVHKLFGVFQRLHRADEFEGTGIGLAIVQRIIARQGGRVWAQGKLNEGATFFFTLKPFLIQPI